METPIQRRLNIHANRYRRKLIEDRKERLRKAEQEEAERLHFEHLRSEAKAEADLVRDTAEAREAQAKPGGTSLDLVKLLHANKEVWS